MPTNRDELPLPELPEVLDGAGILPVPVPLVVAAVAASLLAVTWIVRRRRAGLPVVAARPHEPVPWSGIDVLQALLIHVAVAFAGVAGLAEDAPLAIRLAVSCLATAVGTVFSLAYLIARGASLADLGLGDLRPAEDLRLAVGGLALVVAPVLAFAYAVNLWVPYEHPIVDLLRAQRDSTALAIVAVSAVVVAPLAEELFFRRVLQGWLEKRLPQADGGQAVGLAAAAFALAHAGQGLAFLPLFPLALVLGHLVRRTGSILPAVLLHGLFNAVSLALLLLQTPAPAAAG
jgi:membrane protease YdiL (CAAX protease family)